MSYVKYEQKDFVGIVTIDREKALNALNTRFSQTSKPQSMKSTRTKPAVSLLPAQGRRPLSPVPILAP